MDIISRSEARSLEISYYFTGRPCKRGNISQRRSSTGECLCDSCFASSNLAKSRYHKNNSAKERAAQTIYRNKNKEKISAARKMRAEHKTERRKKYMASYYKEKEIQIYEKKKEWSVRNRDKVSLSRMKWKKDNLDKLAANAAKRRSAKAQRVPAWADELDELVTREAYSLARERSEMTGLEWHVDHALPLQGATVSGFHCAANLQVIPGFLNIAKGNRLIMTEPLEWLDYL